MLPTSCWGVLAVRETGFQGWGTFMNANLQRFLQSIHSDGVLEIIDSEEPDIQTAHLIDLAMEQRFIREDSSGWDCSSRYTLTSKGHEALGITPEPTLTSWLKSFFSGGTKAGV